MCSAFSMPGPSVHSLQILSAHQFYLINFSNFSLISSSIFPLLVKFFTFPPKSLLTICFFDIFFVTL